LIRVIPLRLLLPLAYMSGVFFLSSIPARELHRWGVTSVLANLAHVPLYAGLAWATLWAVLGPVGPRVAWVALACLVFALTDEFHQNFVPGRVFSLVDVGADVVGIGLGITIGLWTSPRSDRESSSA
jgi:VanZ family protein